jgi:hypothetical protein
VPAANHPVHAARLGRPSGSWRPAPSNARHACDFRRPSPRLSPSRVGAASGARGWAHANSAGLHGRGNDPPPRPGWRAAVAWAHTRSWVGFGSGIRHCGWLGTASPKPRGPVEAIRMPSCNARSQALSLALPRARVGVRGRFGLRPITRFQWRASTNRPAQAPAARAQSVRTSPSQAWQGVWGRGMQFASVSVRRDRATRGDRHDP